MDHLDPNISNIPALNKTPVKNVNKTPSLVSQEEEFFSPSKRVIFNLKPQPSTPKLGIKAKSILKTPSKESPNIKDQTLCVWFQTMSTPLKTSYSFLTVCIWFQTISTLLGMSYSFVLCLEPCKHILGCT